MRKYLGVGPVLSEKVYNPLYNATINTTYKKNYTDYTNNTYLEWNIQPGMKLVGRVGLTNRISGGEEFLPGSHLKFINTAEDDFFKRGSYKQTYGKSFSVSSDINLNYSHNWDKHILFANLGANIRSSNSEEYIRLSGSRTIKWITSFLQSNMPIIQSRREASLLTGKWVLCWR